MSFNQAIISTNVAKKFLRTYFANDPTYKELDEAGAVYKNGSINNLSEIFANVRDNIAKYYDKLIIHKDDHNFNDKLNLALECVICNKIHDNIISMIYAINRREDEHLFNKIMLLDRKNVTVEELGRSEEYVTIIHAAVVELSNLDAYKTPIEKLNCLITTIDMIYAQVKLELAEIIDVDDDGISCVPVVENEDAFYILMIVIIKSKQKHLYSNIVFIDELSSILKQEINGKAYADVIETLCMAIERIDGIEIELLPSDNKSKIEKEVSYLEAIEFITDDDDDYGEKDGIVKEEKSFLNYHLRRIRQLIHTSVNF